VSEMGSSSTSSGSTCAACARTAQVDRRGLPYGRRSCATTTARAARERSPRRRRVLAWPERQGIGQG
jgi:hypothetical protein